MVQQNSNTAAQETQEPSQVKQENNLITATIVNDVNDRLNFLPELFGAGYTEGERRVYGLMRRFCSQYKGGYWDFYQLSNGAGFLSLNTDESVRIINPYNYTDEKMSARVAGIVMTLMALNHLIYVFSDNGRGNIVRHLMAKNELLLDYVDQIPESDVIYRAID